MVRKVAGFRAHASRTLHLEHAQDPAKPTWTARFGMEWGFPVSSCPLCCYLPIYPDGTPISLPDVGRSTPAG